MKTFGKAIAVQTAGPDAVEPENLERAKGQAHDMLARVIHEMMRRCMTLGYEVDADTVTHHVEEEDDRIIYSITFGARQTRGLLERIIWAVRL